MFKLSYSILTARMKNRKKQYEIYKDSKYSNFVVVKDFATGYILCYKKFTKNIVSNMIVRIYFVSCL